MAMAIVIEPAGYFFLVFAILFVATILTRAYGHEFLFPGLRRTITHLAIGAVLGVVAVAAAVLIAALFGDVEFHGFLTAAHSPHSAHIRTSVGGLATLFAFAALQEEFLFRFIMFLAPLLVDAWYVRRRSGSLTLPSAAPPKADCVFSRYLYRLYLQRYRQSCDLGARTALGGNGDGEEDTPSYTLTVQLPPSRKPPGASLAVFATILAVVQALVFGGLHLMNPSSTILSTINVALAGLTFVVIITEIGSIWAAFAAHLAWNMTCVLLGLPVSGYFVDTGFAVLSLKLRENGMLSGGDFGLEGGIACTVVLAAIMIAYVAYSAAGASRKTAVGCIANSAPVIDGNNPKCANRKEFF